MTVQITLNNRTYTLPNDIDMGEIAEGSELLVKLHLSREGFSEGIWFVIHEQDLEDYKNNVVDTEYTRIGALGNMAVCGIPWGAYVPYKLQGEDRPVAVFEEIIDVENDEVYYPEAVKAEYLATGMFTDDEE